MKEYMIGEDRNCPGLKQYEMHKLSIFVTIIDDTHFELMRKVISTITHQCIIDIRNKDEIKITYDDFKNEHIDELIFKVKKIYTGITHKNPLGNFNSKDKYLGGSETYECIEMTYEALIKIIIDRIKTDYNKMKTENTENYYEFIKQYKRG